MDVPTILACFADLGVTPLAAVTIFGVAGGSAVKGEDVGLGLDGLFPPVAASFIDGIRGTGEPVPRPIPGLEITRGS